MAPKKPLMSKIRLHPLKHKSIYTLFPLPSGPMQAAIANIFDITSVGFSHMACFGCQLLNEDRPRIVDTQNGLATTHNCACFCGQNTDHPYGKIDKREPKRPSVFHDLTKREMRRLWDYLYSNRELNLTVPEKVSFWTNHLYLAELHLPPKQVVLDHLDKGYRKPIREARVILIRGGIPIPDIQELIVGPLHNPRYHRCVPYRPKSISFLKRPITIVDAISDDLTKLVDRIAGRMLLDLYDGYLTECREKCLKISRASKVNSPISGVQNILYWFNIYQFTEYYLLRPLDFALLVDKTLDIFHIVEIWFNGRRFRSLEDTVAFYNQNKYLFQKISFPKVSKFSPLTMNKRGHPHFSVPTRNPSQVYPSGKRYNVKGKHVTYSFWDFDIGMSPIFGPKLFDIRFKGERIVYEISLQEITAFYAGHKPIEYTSAFLDGSVLFGTDSKYLVPGVDCPYGATYLSAYFQLGKQKEPIYNPRAFCVFEFNTGIPLRRHHGHEDSSHRFYEGMVSVVLIARTIVNAANYDYVIDFIFYQNGAIEVKIISTGVMIGTFHAIKNPYGFEINKNLMAPLHQHLYHFKVDIDIKGTKNRFKTINIENDVIPNIWNKHAKDGIHQIRYTERLKEREKDAAYKFNFDSPKLLVFSNNRFQDKYGNVPGFRILNQGMSKNLRPPNTGNEPLITWSQYQVAVTKQKDSEPRSSSVYEYFGGPDDPVVRFQDFIDDNENIVDEVSILLRSTKRPSSIAKSYDPLFSSSPLTDIAEFFSHKPYLLIGCDTCSSHPIRIIHLPLLDLYY